MKICPRCGKANVDADNFCTGCGFKFPAPAPAAPQPEPRQEPQPQWQPNWQMPPEQPEEPESPKEPKKKKPVALIIALVFGFIIIGLLTAILILLIQKGPDGLLSFIGHRETAVEESEKDRDPETSDENKPGESSTGLPEDAFEQPVEQISEASDEETSAAESAIEDGSSETAEESQAAEESKQAPIESVTELPAVSSLTRASLMAGAVQLNDPGLVPAVPAYSVAADFSNITNNEILSFNDDVKQMIVQNGFVVEATDYKEFYQLYLSNRYFYMANFVTTDSMMHTYHLYFAYLMKNTEKNYLSSTLLSLSEKMLSKSLEQLDKLKGTEWEEAALTNVAFFSVGTCLQNEATVIPADVVSTVTAELELIKAQSAMAPSPLTGIDEDYTQYKPRGYYEGDPQLESYFRAMMWYGRLNFKQKNETLDRSALLMTLALDAETLPIWESIYSVTSFFAGASDDAGYYEYKPLIDAAFGEGATVEKLAGNADGWSIFHGLTAQLDPPKINSVPTYVNSETDVLEENKGFRFMGQRFTLDASIFQNLTYNAVKEKSPEERRMLPDTLDVMAAMGSEEAMAILQTTDAPTYPGYLENMETLRQEIANTTEDQWNTSLYSSWLYTLKPLLNRKGEGYPYFMQSSLWAKKDMETYAGSFTELKHDTVLYAKQQMGGKGDGGWDIPTPDDRGYVEPEPELFSRLAVLTQKTAEGLKSYGMLSEADEANLLRLSDLAKQFMTMSEKELRNETLTPEEYDIIRNFGDDLQYFWNETIKEEAAKYQEDGISSLVDYFPAALIVDVATDPNGSCLEIATGNPSIIYVACLVDGDVKICSGLMYNWYQFDQPISDRMTDTQWRQLIGIQVMDDGSYNRDAKVEKPAWTLEYRYDY